MLKKKLNTFYSQIDWSIDYSNRAKIMKRKFLDILEYVRNKMIDFLKFLNLTKVKLVMIFKIRREGKF